MSKRPLNVGLIGGGGGAFIAHPHQKAINCDGTRRVTCAALHPDPNIAMQEAANWSYPIRGYPSYDSMIEEESRKPLGERVDYVTIVTPNKCISTRHKSQRGGSGFLREAADRERRKRKTGGCLRQANIRRVAHTYLGTANPLCRHVVRTGLFCEVRWGSIYYIQGWLKRRKTKVRFRLSGVWTRKELA